MSAFLFQMSCTNSEPYRGGIYIFSARNKSSQAERDHRMIRVSPKDRRQAPSWGETARAARRIRVSQRRLTAVGAAGAQLAGGRREERRLT